METIYFWKDNKVHEYLGSNDRETVEEAGFANSFAVDTSCDPSYARYGKYLKNGWRHLPLTNFPKKFRTHLLLLGVT